MQADVQTKVSARQVLIDELEAAKPKPAPRPSAEPGKASAPASGLPSNAETPLQDVDMEDADAEGEDEGVTPAAARPDGESPAFEEEDEEDLFGDEGTEDGTAAGTGDEGGDGVDDGEGEEDAEGEEEDGGDEGEDASGDEEGGDDDADGEGEGDEEGAGVGAREQGGDGEEYDEDGDGVGMGDEEEDEMAAMLRAELGDLVTDSSPAAMSVGTPGAEAQAQADAYNALNNFAMAGGMEALPFEPASSPAYREYSGVEGGVGMRRLAEGVEEDDDSSDESDD